MTRIADCTALCLLGLAGASAAAPAPNEDWRAVAAADGVQRITVQCGSDFIDPRRIVVRANRPVELTVYSPKATSGQTFVLRYPGADISQPATRKPVPVLFRATALGRYAMDCQTGPGAPGDPQRMASRRGHLTVEP